MKTYTYTGEFIRLNQKSVLIVMEEEPYYFSLEHCFFEPDALDLAEGDTVTIECPSWLAEKMNLDED